MKEQMKQRADQIKSLPLRLVKAGYPYTLVMLVLGIVLTFWPGQSMWVVYRISAVLLMAVGVFRVFKYFRSTAAQAHEHLIFARGAMLVLAGILLLIYRWALVDLVPVLVAIVLFFVACIRTQAALDLKCFRHRLWFLCLIAAGIEAVLGLLAVLLITPLITTVLTLCGIGLLLEGIADLYTRLIIGRLQKMDIHPDDPKAVFSLKARRKEQKEKEEQAEAAYSEAKATETEAADTAAEAQTEEGDLFAEEDKDTAPQS